MVRSKDSSARLLSFEALAARLTDADADWTVATAELARLRLNLRESETAPLRWAGDPAYVLYRLTPVSGPGERPGAYPDDGGRAAPVPTRATTTTPRPWVLHRRGGSGSALS